jgi:thymidylate kinase
MLVEFAGGTGSGKSTLARRVESNLRKNSLPVVWARQLLPYAILLRAVRNERAQNVLMDVLLSLHARRAAGRYGEFLHFSNLVNHSYADTIGVELKIKRSIRRKLALHSFLNDLRHDDQIVFVDEGTVHIAHNLFAQVKTAPGDMKDDLIQFFHLVPTPDIVIVVNAPLDSVIKRSLDRNDQPRGGMSDKDLTRFASHGSDVFHRLLSIPSMPTCVESVCWPDWDSSENIDIVSRVERQIMARFREVA